MFSKIKEILTSRIETAYAHCDVPCGIYDPYPAQIDAHTIVRMMDLIAALDKNDPTYGVKFARYVAVKEHHGEHLKNEIRVIWGDFLNKDNTSAYPDISAKVWTIMKQASATRQTTDKAAAQTLLASVLEFAEMFWKIKGKSTRRIASPYPSGGEMVLPE